MCQLRFVVGICAVVCMLTVTSFAGSASGSIVGTVTDQTSAVIAVAAVEIRNQSTGMVRNGVTDQSGEYNFVLLPPGVYDLTVRVQGFRDGVYRGIKLDVDQVARANLTLQIATAKEGVSVTGEVPLVEADTSSMGQVVQNGLIAGLPLNERNYLNFTLLVPGAHPRWRDHRLQLWGQGRSA